MSKLKELEERIEKIEREQYIVIDWNSIKKLFRVIIIPFEFIIISIPIFILWILHSFVLLFAWYKDYYCFMRYGDNYKEVEIIIPHKITSD